MPIAGRCQGCGRKFQAPDNLAGKRVKCPKCSAVIQLGAAAGPMAAPESAERKTSPPPPPALPTGETADWLVETTDGERFGPMSKTQLDGLVATGRLDAFCRVRREGWDQWKWAEEVCPQLAASAGAETDAEIAAEQIGAGAESPLSPCPDCGKMISRRASQCPHCGCPVAVAADQGDAAGAGRQPGAEAPPDRRLQPVGNMGSVAAISRSEKRTSRKQIVLFVSGAASVAALIAVVALAVKWPLSPAADPLEEATIRTQPPGEQTTPAGRAEAEAATPEARETWIKETSAAMAKEVDDAYRKTHLAMSLLGRAHQNVDLIRSLAEIAPVRGRQSDPAPTPAPDDKPYQSKYDSLYKECLAYVRSNVSSGDPGPAEIRAAARRWADDKLAPLEQQLENELGKQLGF